MSGGQKSARRRPFAIVVAADEELGIGRDGDLPWHLPGDLAYFADLTRTAPEGRRNAVIMGRKTWESIPERFRPLAGRLNVVVTRAADYDLPGGARRAGGLESALVDLPPQTAAVFVVGGSQIYALAIEHERCAEVYLTRVSGHHGCDVFFPPFEHRFARDLILGEGDGYRIERWTRRP